MARVIVMVIATALLFCIRGGAEAFSAEPSAKTAIVATDVPPLLDVPVWSMATLNDDTNDNEKPAAGATTNMNLLTYATPVSIRPNRLYALGLYKETKSRENFLREKTCILQLLSASNEKHVEIVRLLGGTSGKDVSKEDELSSAHGIDLRELPAEKGVQGGLPKVLPGCVRYLQLSMVGDEIGDYDGGESSHDVVICKVDKTWTSSELNSGEKDGNCDNGGDHLSTGWLRELGLITEQGRIAPLPTDE